jgi:hypothetical protein
VVVRDHIKAFVNNEKVFDIHDSDVIGRSFVGLFHRGVPLDRFEDFLVTLPPDVLPPTPTPTPTPAPTPTPVPPVVADSFNSHFDPANPVAEFPLAGTTPETGPSGAAWYGAGWGVPDWKSVQTDSGRAAVQRTPGNLEWRLLVDSGENQQMVEATITRNDGLVGLVARYGDEGNFVFGFVTGDGATLYLARIEGGAFVSMGASTISWPLGDSRSLRLIATDSGMSLWLDGVALVDTPYGGMSANTSAGLFGRDTVASLWDDFVVTTATGP